MEIEEARNRLRVRRCKRCDGLYIGVPKSQICPKCSKGTHYNKYAKVKRWS